MGAKGPVKSTEDIQGERNEVSYYSKKTTTEVIKVGKEKRERKGQGENQENLFSIGNTH